MNDASALASPTTTKLHPLLIAAALSVIGVSALAAVALVKGPASALNLTDAEQAAVQPAPMPPAPVAAEPVQPQLAVTPQPASKRPVAKRTTSAAPAPVAVATPAPVTPPADAPPPRPAIPSCDDCGVVAAIREVRTPGSANGVGAIAGGVVGAVIGNQIGNGSGRDAARILGAIGGAVAGHHIEKHARTTTRYEIDIRMDNGQLRTVSRGTPPELRVGDTVRLRGDTLLLHDGRPITERQAPVPFDREGA